MPHFYPSGAPSFLSPDFIHFPGSTPAVPQPQYPSSDGGSSTPSTPASTRSASSNSSGREKSKARTYNHDPKYPTGATHWHSKHNGKCPDCGRSGALTEPKWHSQKKKLFIRCKEAICKYWRYTDYIGDPPASAPSHSASAADIPSGITRLCLAEPCSTGNKRNRNLACVNKMCLQDCIKHGRADCPEHRRAKQAHLSGTAVGRPPSVLFNGPSLPSMPSIPPPTLPPSLPSSTLSSYTPSFLDVALPPSSPNPANPQSLLDITTSTVKPSRNNPLPRPFASPLQEGPTFQEVRRYARDLPHDWAEVIATQQTAKAQQMLYEAQFRSSIKEGVGLTVVMWKAQLGVAPFLFERVIHSGREYSLSEDVDLCTAIGFDPATVFVLNYLGGMWSHRSPRERHAVKPGSFLFFREAGPVIAYEDPLLRFDELLALATDPAFGGASAFLATPPTAVAVPPPAGPRPRPRPKNRPLGLPKVDHRYNWIAARVAAVEPDMEPGTTEASSEPSTSSVPTSTASSSSSLSSGPDDSQPKRNWPHDYTVKEIDDGFVIMANKGRAKRGSGIMLSDRFYDAFPDAEKWITRRYYTAHKTWESYTVDGSLAQKNAFEAWKETDAYWTSIFGEDVGSPPPKKRKVEVHVEVDLD